MSMAARRRATLLLGLLFSVPAFRTWSDGGIDIATMAIRVAIAMVAAYLAVWVIAMLVDGYTPKEGPPVEEDATGDDVEVEDGVAAEPGDEG
jgi:hypothetical protein